MGYPNISVDSWKNNKKTTKQMKERCEKYQINKSVNEILYK